MAGWRMMVLSCVVLSSLSLPLTHAQQAPLVYWYNHPVQPNETVLVFGAGLTSPIVNLCYNDTNDCINPAILDSWEYSVKFLVPDTAKKAAYFFNVCDKQSCSPMYGINVPEIWWLTSDQGTNATEWVKIFGKSLAFTNGDCVAPNAPANGTSTTVLLDNGKEKYNITDIQATCYDLFFSLPSGIVPGTYNVSVQNSLWDVPISVTRDDVVMQVNVVPPIPIPSTTFDVRKQFQGNLSAAVQAANTAGGGIVYLSSGPSIYMKDQEVLTLNDGVFLSGDGSTESQIYWDANSAIPATPLITTLGRFGIQQVGLMASSPTKAIIHVTYTSSGFIRNIGSSRTSMTDVENMFQIDGSNVEISNSFFNHSGDCSKTGWPGNCGFWINGTSYVRLLGNTFDLHCQGYAAFGADYFLMEGNTIISTSNITSDGSGFSTLGRKMYSEKISFLRNFHEGDFYAPVRYESMTSDGPGSAYFGAVNTMKSSATSLTLSSNASYGENDYTLAAVVVVNGTGAGQVRRVSTYSTTSITLTSPLDTALDSSSTISVVPYRGEQVLAGNTWKNGTAVQIFGAGFYSLIAGNYLIYMMPSKQIHPAGIASWGLDYGGVQPTYFTEILDNTLVDAEAITAMASNGGIFQGPYLRSHVIKGNTLTESTFINILGASSDFVIEANNITGLLANQTAVAIASTADHILLR